MCLRQTPRRPPARGHPRSRHPPPARGSGAAGSAGAARARPSPATGATRWLDDPLRDAEPGARFGPVAAALDDALAAGPDAVTTSAAFYLHLSDDDVAELDRRILAVLDEYVASDADRHDRPLPRGLFVLHRPPS